KVTVLCLALLAFVAPTAPAQQVALVRGQTNMARFLTELDTERAPLPVTHFVYCVRSGHDIGTICHRLVTYFVAQAGGYDEKYVERPTSAPVPNESGNGLSNRRGTVGLARTGDPHSGTSQFYVNLVDNAGLDPQPSRWGYAVFGRVIEGMNV